MKEHSGECKGKSDCNLCKQAEEKLQILGLGENLFYHSPHPTQLQRASPLHTWTRRLCHKWEVHWHCCAQRVIWSAALYPPAQIWDRRGIQRFDPLWFCHYVQKSWNWTSKQSIRETPRILPQKPMTSTAFSCCLRKSQMSARPSATICHCTQ